MLGGPAHSEGSFGMQGPMHGAPPGQNPYNLPPAVQPGPGGPPPWQQMPGGPPNGPFPQMPGGPGGGPPNGPFPPMQGGPGGPPNGPFPPIQGGGPGGPHGEFPPMPMQPGGPPWQQGGPPPPWQGGPQSPQQPPWQQKAANQLSQWNQSMNQSMNQRNAGPRVVQGNRTTIALAAIFLGALGVHKFMLGMRNAGLILLLCTLITLGTGAVLTCVVGVIEGIIYFSKSDADFYEIYVVGGKEWF